MRRSIPLLLISMICILLTACRPNATTSIPPTAAGTRLAGPLPTLTSLKWRAASDPITSGNLDALDEIGTLLAHDATVNHLVFSHDGNKLLTVDATGVTVLWDLLTGQIVSRPGKGLTTQFSFFAADDKTIVSVVDDGKVYFIKAQDGVPINSAPSNSNGVVLALMSTDGKTLATGGKRGDVMLWDTVSYRVKRIIPSPHGNYVTALAFSPDNATIAANIVDAPTTLYQVDTGATLTTLAEANSVQRLEYSRDGKQLAAATSNEIRIYETSKYTVQQLFSLADMSPNRGMAFSPDGSLFAVVGSGDFVYLWVLSNSKTASGLPQHNGYASSVSFAPNGQFLLTTIVAAHIGSLLWDVQSLKANQNSLTQGKRLAADGNGQFIGVWSPDSRMIILADDSGGITVWGIPRPS